MSQTARGKRELVQLAETWTDKTGMEFNIGHWYFSEKLDGMRALWLPDTRGMVFSDVIFGNLVAGKRGPKGIGSRTVSGLWSRYGRPIWCPDSWVKKMLSDGTLAMDRPLDGELWMGRGRQQEVMSVVKTVSNAKDYEWGNVGYCVFDSPRWVEVYSDGKIHNANYKKDFGGVYEHMLDSNPLYRHNYRVDRMRKESFEYLVCSGIVRGLPYLKQLNWHPAVAKAEIEANMKIILDQGGEGGIVRHGGSIWVPLRVNSMFKIKPYEDSEGKVIGYNDGVKRLEGTVGSVLVEWKGQDGVSSPVQFSLSGWTDSERDQIREGVVCKIGEIITFRYRELSVAGVPKEARYLRPKVEE